jgi:ribosomal protein S18 acetylase RimI-like enzyme
MRVLVRSAQHVDRAELVALDSVAASDPFRVDAIDQWLKHSEVFVADTGGPVVGYAVLGRRRFFGYDMLEMLMVATQHRRQGIAGALLRHLEQLAQTKKFFVTTNLSNQTMQGLLRKLEYTACGFIDQLDPGDPEIVFVKTLQKINL